MIRVRDVRLVGLEEVDPEKQRSVRGGAVQVLRDLPLAQRRVRELHLGVFEAEALALEARKARLVDEEDRGGIERRGAPTVTPKLLGPRLRVLAQSQREQRPQVLAGHHRRDRIRRVRRGAVRVLEERPFSRERVEVWRGRSRVAVRRYVVSAQSVDRHEHQVAPDPVQRAGDLARDRDGRGLGRVLGRRRTQSHRDGHGAAKQRRVLDEHHPQVRRAIEGALGFRRPGGAGQHHERDGGRQSARDAPGRPLADARPEGRDRGARERRDEHREVERRVEPRQDVSIRGPRCGREAHAEHREGGRLADARHRARDPPSADDGAAHRERQDERRAHSPAGEVTPVRDSEGHGGSRDRPRGRENANSGA